MVGSCDFDKRGTGQTYANEVRNLLVHGAVLVRVGEARAAKFLLDGVEAFVQVVAVVWDAGAGGVVGCGSGVHGLLL